MAEISGLVQRLKWAAESKAVFVYIGPMPSATRLLLILLDSDNTVELAFQRASAHLLSKAQAAGLPVRVVYDTDSRITSVDTRLSRVRTEAIEVTQAIQNLYHSVTLVASKTTVVRVYLSNRTNPPLTVRGELQITRSAGPPVTVASLNQVLLDAAAIGQVDQQRRDVTRSLNFLLPVDQTTAGGFSVRLSRLTDVANGGSIDPGPTSPIPLTFVAGPPLRLRVLGISYPFGNPPQTQTPSTLDFDLVHSWLRRAYPIPSVISSQAIVPATAAVPFTCGQVNAQVAAIRALDVAGGADNRTHYYGLASDGGFFMRGCAAVPGSPDPAAIGSGPTGPANWGWDFDGSYGDWYTGHELGHTFGRKHPGACGESNDDLAYPFTAGQLSNADNAFVGVDVGDATLNLPMTALPGTDWHDVMTYCSRQWLSSYTYEGIRARLLAEDALGAGAGPMPGAGRPDERFPDNAKLTPQTPSAVPRQLISVIATVTIGRGEGKIDYVNPLPQGEVTPPDPSSPVALRVTGPQGRVAYEAAVPVKPLSDTPEGDDQRFLVDAVIAADADASAIELLVGGRTVDVFRRSRMPPSVRAVRGVEKRGAASRLTWQTDASPDSTHTYTIQASVDAGRTWQTLAVGLRSPEVEIDERQFRSAPRVLVRVIATDGFTRSDSTIELPRGGGTAERE